jgi:hypothetical protein
MAKKATGNQKDLFHGQGNQTVALPKGIMGKTVMTDPHTSPGKLLPTKKTVQKGWNK